MTDTPPRYAVIGAGIAGLAAAWDLSRRGQVTVFDPDPPGGKLTTDTFEGQRVELGPDAFLTRVPDAVDLCAELGLTRDLIPPATGAAMVWTGAGLAPMPEGLVLGVPRTLRGIRRSPLLTRRGVARAALDLVLPRNTDLGRDLSVHDLVARRFGPQIASRLVDPLVGGIHAGRIDDLSAEATTPQLIAAARRSRSLMRALTPAGKAPEGPTFLTPRSGLTSMVERLTGGLAERGVTFRPQSVRQVRSGRGARMVVDSGDEPWDGVVLALPARAASSVLGPDAPRGLGAITTASVAIVLMSYDTDALRPPPGISGFLVPRHTGRLMTACSFASTKWPHWAAPGATLLRVSVGRAGDGRFVDLDNDELVGRLSAEVNEALGAAATPRAARVVRWPDSFPQYCVGHLALVDGIEEDLRRIGGRVTVAGASYRGSGIPACIRSGRQAAARLLEAVDPRLRADEHMQ